MLPSAKQTRKWCNSCWSWPKRRSQRQWSHNCSLHRCKGPLVPEKTGSLWMRNFLIPSRDLSLFLVAKLKRPTSVRGTLRSLASPCFSFLKSLRQVAFSHAENLRRCSPKKLTRALSSDQTEVVNPLPKKRASIIGLAAKKQKLVREELILLHSTN